jgi:2-haloacid dehalogenase
MATAIKALLFDTFGTTVDWFSSMTEHGQRLGAERGIEADWAGLAKAWRARYKPAIKPVRERKRKFTGFDVLHREQLDNIVGEFGLSGLSSNDRDRLTQGWHALKPWPDVVPALHRLKRHYVIGPLSNGTLRQMADLAKFGGLPWDVLFGANMFLTYKPDPILYVGAAHYLELEPEEVLMVAAHNEDLSNAKKHGMRTCFVHRPTEDSVALPGFDYVVNDFEELARKLRAV